MFHYVYKIYWKSQSLRYYGARSCATSPYNDLGIEYFSSSTNKSFIRKQHSNPEDFEYTILFETSNRKEALHLRQCRTFQFIISTTPRTKKDSLGTEDHFTWRREFRSNTYQIYYKGKVLPLLGFYSNVSLDSCLSLQSLIALS